MRGARAYSTVVLLLVMSALMVTGCTGRSADDAPGPETRSKEVTGPIELGSAEVREYQGQRLGSVTDFRENSIEGPQEVDRDDYRLKVVGLVGEPLELRYNEVLALPHYEKVVRINCVEGWSVDVLWEGVLLSDLLERADYQAAEDRVVVFRCYDGYSTSLPLDYIVDNDILLAYKINGMELPAERGFPFSVVAQDRWGYKWARWVTSIEVSDDTDFRGYWESRGYDNDASLPSAR